MPPSNTDSKSNPPAQDKVVDKTPDAKSNPPAGDKAVGKAITVIATSPIHHDGVLYEVEEEIKLALKQAKELIALGVAKLKAAVKGAESDA